MQMDRKYPDQFMNIEDLMLDFTLPGYDIELRVSMPLLIPMNF